MVAGALAAMLLGGCNSNAEQAATLPATGAPVSTFGVNAPVSPAATTPPTATAASTDAASVPSAVPATDAPAAAATVALAPEEPVSKLHYSKKQLQEIREAAQQAGLEQVYIPTAGGGPDDYFEEAKVDGARLTLHFIQMAITESAQQLEPADPGRTVKTVWLAEGWEGKWINESESTVAYLYASLGTTHFQVFSASPFDGTDFEAAARSMILLQ